MARESGFGGGADLPAMTRELETSINLDPTFADSYALLAFAQSTSGDAPKALVTMQKALAISPRNENYLFNLANIYLANRQPDQTIAILHSLQVTDNPELASRVAAMLAQAQRFREIGLQGPLDRGVGPVVTPKENSENPASPQITSQTSVNAPVKAQTNVISSKFVRGVLDSVDCSADSSAVLTVVSGPRTWKMKVADKDHMILIGTDQFSCSWLKQKVAVNYRENGGEISVISLEIQ